MQIIDITKNDERVIRFSLSDGTTIYMLSQTKMLKRLNDHLQAHDLTFEILYINPTDDQKANATVNEDPAASFPVIFRDQGLK
jgi:hypothetical protein